MQPKTLLSLCILFLLSFAGFTQGQNPFKSIGKKGNVLTLSNGKYDESFEKDSLERIGTAIINRYTRKIEKFSEENSLSKSGSQSNKESRFLSVDPLTKKFAELTPYQYASNSPISGTDLDGEEYKFHALDWKDKAHTKLKVGKLVRTEDDITLKLVFRVGSIDGGNLIEIPVTVARGPVGLSGNYVNYNGKSVEVPDNLTNNLPAQNNDIWNTFKTEDENDENFLGAVNQIVSTVQNLAALKGIIGSGEFVNFLKKGGLSEKIRELKSLRKQAVSNAWKQERALVEETGRGSVEWTKKEISELKKTGKVKGYVGHHINSVNGAPELAGEANNIEFVKGQKANLERHGGNFQNPTQGELIDRQKMLEEHRQQQSGGSGGNN